MDVPGLQGKKGYRFLREEMKNGDSPLFNTKRVKLVQVTKGRADLKNLVGKA